MQGQQTDGSKSIRWPDLTGLEAFGALPYRHARLNLLEAESRLLARYLRSKRSPDQIRRQLDDFAPSLGEFLTAGGLAAAMYRIRPSDTRLAEEHLYYQDLAPELNTLIYETFSGLLQQDELFDLGQAIGKGSLIALHNLNLLNQEREHPHAKAEYRIMRQFRDQHFPTLRPERMASHHWHVPELLFYETDYTASDLTWIDKQVFQPLVLERRELAADQGFLHFSSLAKRRIGILDDAHQGRVDVKEAIAKWLVPIAAQARYRVAQQTGRHLVDLYPTAAATVHHKQDLPAPLGTEVETDLAQTWGEPGTGEEMTVSPLNEAVTKILADVLGPDVPPYFEQLAKQSYIQESNIENHMIFCLPAMEVPFIAMVSMHDSKQLAETIASLGYALSLLATNENPMPMLRFPAMDAQSAKGFGLVGLVLDRLPGAYLTPEEGKQVRDALLVQLLNDLIYTAMVEEFEDFCYSDESDDVRRNEEWLRLMERWYPDLADDHEWLLIQEESWRLIPSLVLAPYYGVAEFSSRLLALQLWDLAKDDAEGARAAYLRLIAAKRSDSLEESIRQAKLRPQDDTDVVKRLAYQMAFGLGY